MVEIKALLDDLNRGEWQSALERIKDNPCLAIVKISTKSKHNTVLHQAMSNGNLYNLDARIHFMKEVLQVNKRAASVADGAKQIPLETLALSTALLESSWPPEKRLELAKAFVQAHSNPTKQDEDGDTLLHNMLSSRTQKRHLIAFVAGLDNGAACLIKNAKGYLPAHVGAANDKCTLKTMEMILDLYPDAIVAKTNQGDTALSLASKLKKPKFQLLDYLNYAEEAFRNRPRPSGSAAALPPPVASATSSEQQALDLSNDRTASEDDYDELDVVIPAAGKKARNSTCAGDAKDADDESNAVPKPEGLSGAPMENAADELEEDDGFDAMGAVRTLVNGLFAFF
ncbi:hypothetical protein MPSEU_000738900 [Mayamaea pseudoterrestris]|nr:hypothetical protein MPSEU_000738900 [Mayamaea pseudoterrestris]